MSWEHVAFAVAPGTGVVILGQYRLSIDKILADTTAVIPFESGLATQTFVNCCREKKRTQHVKVEMPERANRKPGIS